jgi:hypothetical protein
MILGEGLFQVSCECQALHYVTHTYSRMITLLILGEGLFQVGGGGRAAFLSACLGMGN